MTEYLLDTWVWVEYYEGSEAGKKLYRLIQSEGRNLYISRVTLAELSDTYHMDKLVTDHSWEEIDSYVRQNSEILEITDEIISTAGEIKANEREDKPDFGLMDAIILATARQNNLTLLTGDPHLTNKQVAIDLRNSQA